MIDPATLLYVEWTYPEANDAPLVLTIASPRHGELTYTLPAAAAAEVLIEMRRIVAKALAASSVLDQRPDAIPPHHSMRIAKP